MTIFEAILNFTGTSIAGGITWDILKTSGTKLLNSFKNKFMDNKCFDNENQCENFWRDIITTSSISKKSPYKDVESIYENVIDNPNNEFISGFQLWIEENIEKLKELTNNATQIASVHVGNQKNSGSGNIINTGIWNGNLER